MVLLSSFTIVGFALPRCLTRADAWRMEFTEFTAQTTPDAIAEIIHVNIKV